MSQPLSLSRVDACARLANPRRLGFLIRGGDNLLTPSDRLSELAPFWSTESTAAKKDARSAKKREEIATARESVQWGPLQKEGRPGDGERRKPPEKGGNARRAEERARRAESGGCHLEEEEPHTGEKMAEAIQGTAQSCTEGRAQGPRRRSVDGEDGEE